MSTAIETKTRDTSSSPLSAFVRQREGHAVRLHLGCGGRSWRDFINVDLYPFDPNVTDTSRSGCIADVFADMRSLGLPDNTVDEIFTAHTLEHFTRWEAVDMLTDWYRMMKPDAKLILETPDFTRCALWLIHPQKRKRAAAQRMFYGNQWNRIDFETHRYVWSARELKRVLREVGFCKVSITHRTWTHFPGRDMRVHAIK